MQKDTAVAVVAVATVSGVIMALLLRHLEVATGLVGLGTTLALAFTRK